MNEKQIKSKIAEGSLYTRIILEIVGMPKEYVEESLKTYLKKIKADKNYNIIKEHVEKAEKQDTYFTTFAELEVLMKNSMALLAFCFDYMPSSVEIIEPGKILTNNNEFTGFVNDMLARSHALNSGVIELSEKNKFYVRNTAVLLRNFLVVLLSSKPMTLKQMRPYLGVQEEDIGKVLEVLIKEGKVKKQGEVYSVIPK